MGLTEILEYARKAKDAFAMVDFYTVEVGDKTVEVLYEVAKQLKTDGHTIISKRAIPSIAWEIDVKLPDGQTVQELKRFYVDAEALQFRFPRSVADAVTGSNT